MTQAWIEALLWTLVVFFEFLDVPVAAVLKTTYVGISLKPFQKIKYILTHFLCEHINEL